MFARIAPPLTVACAGLLWMACNSCPLGLLDRLGPPPTLPQTIECCGASLHVDVTVPDVDELQVDLANTLFPGQNGRVDVWLTDVSCAELFDATYPSGTPRCRTLIGPVQVNTVSSRVSVQPGRYRVFVQSHSSNTTTQRYDFDVGVWGRSCRASPTSP